jgi:hypothetical protein
LHGACCTEAHLHSFQLYVQLGGLICSRTALVRKAITTLLFTDIEDWTIPDSVVLHFKMRKSDLTEIHRLTR